MSAAQVYEEHIKSLPIEARLQLLAIIAEQLASERGSGHGPQHSLMELRGLGQGDWAGLDAQEYVNRLRDECHDRAE